MKQSQKVRRKLTKECPLADPEIGIISENDHRVGLCLCQFCTCGSHVCPAKPVRKSLPYRSNYRCDFLEKEFSSPIKKPPNRYLRNPQKMELKTIHNTDFVPFTVKPGTAMPSQSPSKSLEMVSRSIYSSEFPNWGPPKICHEKQWFQPPQQLPFKADSSYRHCFKNKNGQKAQVSDLLFTADKDNVHFGPDVFGHETTYKQSMNTNTQFNINKRYQPRKIKHKQASVSPTHFHTTSGDTYKPAAMNPKDPRYIRNALLSRN